MSRVVDEDSNDSSSNEEEHEDGYCHFNSNESCLKFDIELYGFKLELSQKPDAGKELGHGAVVWDAAVVFTKYMEHSSSAFSVGKCRNQTVLELGSGCGLGGLAFMIRGAKVVCTDLKCVTDALTGPNVHRIYTQVRPHISFQSAMRSGDDGAVYEPVVTPFDWTTSNFEAAVNKETLVLLETRAAEAAAEAYAAEIAERNKGKKCLTEVEAVAVAVAVTETQETQPSDHSLGLKTTESPAVEAEADDTRVTVGVGEQQQLLLQQDEVSGGVAAALADLTVASPVSDPDPDKVAATGTLDAAQVTTAATTTSPSPVMQRPPSIKFDVILLTDCIFSVTLVTPLINILRHYSNSSTTVYCCHEIRDVDANALFVTELSKYFRVKRITYNKLHPEYRSKYIQVLQAKLLRS